ncbi:MAG: hypothetical protein JXB00_13500 [Bacteroidales bacterium]|nr:hypothetical protein [Bacteroidales bacterium]
MRENKKLFVKDLDLLIELLKKIKEKCGDYYQNSANHSVFNTLEIILAKHDRLGRDVSEKLLDKFGEPIHTLVTQMINELKAGIVEEEMPKNHINMDLLRIDELLASPEIRDDEINRLLDRRSELLAIKYMAKSNN